MHHCNWESLAKPKTQGGWGIRNIFTFNTALAANSLWRVLTTKGIWSMVIKDKYLSIYLSGHLAPLDPHSLPGLPHRHGGTSQNRHIGLKNGSAGSQAPTTLSIWVRTTFWPWFISTPVTLPLIQQLNHININYLYQAAHFHEQGHPFYWLEIRTRARVSYRQEEEWDSFCGTNRVGIQLHNTEDQLMWAGGDNSGHTTVKNIYTAIANSTVHNNILGWRKKLWIWKIPLKIKLFNWLANENKIPTWDNLLRKGWMGPNICQLCNRDAESVQHLFIHCHFTQVWDKIAIDLNTTSAWNGTSLSDLLHTLAFQRAHS
jgi:hypothetical protein